MSSGGWTSYMPSWMIQESKDERTRQAETQADLRQNQRDLMRQRSRLESKQREVKRAAERNLKNGDTRKAKQQYQCLARMERESDQLDAYLNDITSMSNSAAIAGSQQVMMKATQSMTRAMKSGPNLQQQRQAIQEYSMEREQSKMTREMMQDMMYQSDSEEDDDGESIGSRAEEMMQRAQDKMNLESGNGSLEGSDGKFIGLVGAPQIPMQDPAEMVEFAKQKPSFNRSKQN